ncbi:hypothetical protein SLS58_009639 [Diplodia intermedia]|uniref:Clr5 domain-containing protein n=1 Tax=Diplodia intermedia TaxID=856260 RepID=A0ABR3TB50_9PEZI
MASNTNPAKRPRSALKYDWAQHKDKIATLYEMRGYQQMAREMEKIGFTPSRRAYLNKLKEWGVEKNISSAKMRFMAEKAAKRKAQEGKETIFAWQGRRVAAQRIERYRRRRVEGAGGGDDGGAGELADEAAVDDGKEYAFPDFEDVLR